MSSLGSMGNARSKTTDKNSNTSKHQSISDEMVTRSALAASNSKSNQRIKIPINIIPLFASDKYTCKFNMYALYDNNETIASILDAVHNYINKKYSPVNFKIFQIYGKTSFICSLYPFDVFFDAGLENIKGMQ